MGVRRAGHIRACGSRPGVGVCAAIIPDTPSFPALTPRTYSCASFRIFCGNTPPMADDSMGEPPLIQRLYDKIWLLAVVAFLFWLVSYVLWGYLDIVSIPGVILA